LANTFTREVTRNIGAALTAVGGYTPGGGVETVVIGLVLANTLTHVITVDVTLYDGANDYYLMKGKPIAAGSNLDVLPAEKLVMVPGDNIRVKSSDATSVDAVMSIMERS
jgi:hypothetical protein